MRDAVITLGAVTGVGYILILSSIFALAGLFIKLGEVMIENNGRRTIDGNE